MGSSSSSNKRNKSNDRDRNRDDRDRDRNDLDHVPQTPREADNHSRDDTQSQNQPRERHPNQNHFQEDSPTHLTPTHLTPVPESEHEHEHEHKHESEQTQREKIMPVSETIKCRKHISNDVTHICESTEELLCRSCSTRVAELPEYQTSVVDIDTYTNSMKFKQIEARTSDQLRTRKTYLAEELKFIDYHEAKALGKRDEMVEEVNTFTDTLVELIRHMQRELCTKVDTTMNDYVTTLKQRREYIEAWQEELHTIQENIKQRESESKNTALHLRSVLDCKSFVTTVKSNVHQKKESSDFKLRLNKLLTLKDIVGSKESTGNITLGEVVCGNKESARSEILSVNSEYNLSQELSDTEDAEGKRKQDTSLNDGASGAKGDVDVSDKLDSGIKSAMSDKDRAISDLKDDKDRAVSNAMKRRDDIDRDVKSALSNNGRAISNIRDDKDQAARDVKSVLSEKDRAISNLRDRKVDDVNDAMKRLDDNDLPKNDLANTANDKMRSQFGREMGLAEDIQKTSSPVKSQARRLSTPKINRDYIFSPMW